MRDLSIAKPIRNFVFFCSILLHLFTGFCDDSNSSGTGTKVVIIFLAIAVVLLFGLFLFKLWQKKKREEQYARLLKLFEEDDELEVELGMRD